MNEAQPLKEKVGTNGLYAKSEGTEYLQYQLHEGKGEA